MAEENPKPNDISPAPSPPSPQETGYIKGDDGYTRWRNTFALLMGRLTPAGKEQYRLDRDRLFEKEDCRRCEKHRDYLLNYSPIIRFMSSKISQLNGDLDASNIRCQRCTFRHGGGFSPDIGIKICANEMRNRGHLEDTLAHEMIHAYDYLRFKVEWTNLRHAACTEIRASNLSGECRLMREWVTRGQWRLTQQHQECVRRRAIISVTNHALCGDKKMAEKVVGEVFESCFADTRPFDEIYR